MEFYYYSTSETFVVLTADQFVGRDDGPLKQQKQDIHICGKNRTFVEKIAHFLLMMIEFHSPSHFQVQESRTRLAV